MPEEGPKPPGLGVGTPVLLQITDIAFGGEGVGRFEDFVVFVPFVLVGEEVEAEITEVKKRFARARPLRVVRSSPARVPAPCRYFGACGGCQYQHIDYTEQLRLKHKQVRDLFHRVGGLHEPCVPAVLPCPRPYGYRNRIMVRSQWDKYKQGLNVGFLRYDNRLVLDLEQCCIAEPALNERLQQVRAQPPPKGGLKVVLRLQPEGWHVPPDSFFQNNFFLLPDLMRVARECLRASGARYLLDLYCGVGFFALELAGQVERFVGVELDQTAVRAARLNAADRRCANGEFVAGRAEELLPALVQRFAPEHTAILLDPPRTGCPRVMLERLRRIPLAQVLYVSCNPATLARDLNALCAGQVYSPVQVIPLDMFPQTQHVECVADLRAGSAASSELPAASGTGG